MMQDQNTYFCYFFNEEMHLHIWIIDPLTLLTHVKVLLTKISEIPDSCPKNENSFPSEGDCRN